MHLCIAGSDRKPFRERCLAGAAAAGLLAGVLLAGCTARTGAVETLPLRQLADVGLPGGATRLDYQALDPATGRLFVAHLGDGTVDVVDVAADKVLGVIPGVAAVHGIAVASDRRLAIASASGSNQVVLIDTTTLREVGRVSSGDTPDGVAYDPVEGRAYVSNEHDTVTTVIDLATKSALPPIRIGGETGNVMYDPVGKRVLINDQTNGELVVIDPKTDTVEKRIPVGGGCVRNHGLFIDGAEQLAFIACEGNATLLVMDLRTDRVTAQFPTGDTPDVLAADESLHRLYVAAEDGTVSVFRIKDRALALLASAQLADSAHTVTVDQATHRVYFPLEDVGGHPVLRIMAPTG